jgi:hypothetical protein
VNVSNWLGNSLYTFHNVLNFSEVLPLVYHAMESDHAVVSLSIFTALLIDLIRCRYKSVP